MKHARILATLSLTAACALAALAQSDEAAQRFHFLPHIADGGGWQSTLLVTNVAQSASQCTLKLYGLDADRFHNVDTVRVSGSTATFDLPGAGAYLTWPTRNLSPLASGYATLDCTEPVVAKVVFASIGSSGTPTGMATVFSSQAGTVFQFPVLTPEATLGFAIANDTNAAADCSIVLEDPQRTNQGRARFAVPSKSNWAGRLLDQIIPVPPTFRGGTATVSCNQPVAMIGLHYELQPDRTIITFNTLPPAVLVPFSQSSDETAKLSHFLPHIADGGGWQSTLLVTNVAQSASQCTLKLYGLDADRFHNVDTVRVSGSTATFDLPGAGAYLTWPTRNLSPLASGYATLDCTEPVVAKVVFASIGSSGTPTGMATVFSSQAGTVFQFPVLTPEATLGFAIANDTNAAADCSIVLEDPQRTNQGRARFAVPSKSNWAGRLLDQIIPVPPTFRGGTATVSCNQPVAMIGLHYELQPDRTIITFNTQPPAILETSVGECAADLIVRPGESCRYPESEELFSVSLTGEMSFLFFRSRVGINIDLSYRDGIRYGLLARNSGDGSWVIVGVAESHSRRSVPTEDCRVGLVVVAAQGCRYPGTDILFITTGTGDGAALHHWAPGLRGTLFVVHAPHSGFFSISYSDVQFSAHRNSDESWTIDRVGDSPPTPFECEVGMIVGPEGSCVYPGTTKRFSVDLNARGSFDGTTDARAIRVTAPGLTFAAEIGQRFWTITVGPIRRSAVPTAQTECRANMELHHGDACRYPGTNHVFWVRGGNGGFDQIQYEYSMSIDADGVVFRAHTLGTLSWIVARVGAASNSPPPPPTRALVDRPDDFTGPQIHVVYAVASDGEDLQLDRSPSSPEYRRLSYRNYGRVSIHSSFRTIQEWLAGQIGQQLRLDTFRGEIDISFVRLPFTEEEIVADPYGMFNRIQSVVRHETRTSKALAIVYHGLEEATAIGGIGELEGDAALLLMRGYIEVTQFGGDHGWRAPYLVDRVMVHEIFHMMGAVPVCASRSAGRTDVEYCATAGHHVADVRDIMGSNNTHTAQIDPDRNDYYGHGYPDCTDISKSEYFMPAHSR